MTHIFNPFISPAQKEALDRDPPRGAVKNVRQNDGKPYVEGEYVIQGLNDIFDQGMWSMTTRIVSTHLSDCKISEKDRGSNNYIQVDGVNAAVTVTVGLHIHALDGSDRKMTIEQSAVGDISGRKDRPVADIIGNAVKSGETDALKRCARLLGPVFGFDIKGKIKEEFRVIVPKTYLTAPPARLAPPAAALPAPAAEPIELKAEVVDRTTQSDNGDRRPAAKPVPERPQPVARAEAGDTGKPREAGAGDRPAAPANDAAFEPWDLSMMPRDGNYAEWIQCMKTMSRQIGQMSLDELDRYEDRNKRLISKIPTSIADEKNVVQNFRSRFDDVLADRRAKLDTAKAA